jgi:hypothetical protein
MAKAARSNTRTSSIADRNAGRADALAPGVDNQLRPEDAAFSSLVFLVAVLIASLALLGAMLPTSSVTPNDAKSLPPHSSSRDNTNGGQAFYSIPELAARWRCSRGTVYNRLRFARAKVLDFASAGTKGKKIVPALTVFQIESKHLKVLP